MRLLVAFLLALLLMPAAASAHYGRAVSAERAVYNSHYNGRCGRGTLRRCAYVGVPVADYARYGHWWHFRDGYYQEWRPSPNPFDPYKLYACKVRGWVMLPSQQYPHRSQAQIIISNSWVNCYRISP